MEDFCKELKTNFEEEIPNIGVSLRINKNTKKITGINIEGKSIIDRFCVKPNSFYKDMVDLQMNQSYDCVSSEWKLLRDKLSSKKILHKENIFCIGDVSHVIIEIKGILNDKWIGLYKTISDILKSFVDNDTEIEESTVPDFNEFPILSTSNEIGTVTESTTITQPVIESVIKPVIEASTDSVIEASTNSVIEPVILETSTVETSTVETSDLQKPIIQQLVPNEIYVQTAAQHYYSLMVSISMQHISDCINIPTYNNSVLYHIRMKDFKIAENAYLQYL